MHSIDQHRLISAPIEQVFRFTSDHRILGRWPFVHRCELLRPGAGDPDGVGSIRRVLCFGLRLEEEVVSWNPPFGYDYRMLRGLPIQHFARVRLEQRGPVTSVAWRIEIESALPGVSFWVTTITNRALSDSLDWVARELQRGSAADLRS